MPRATHPRSLTPPPAQSPCARACMPCYTNRWGCSIRHVGIIDCKDEAAAFMWVGDKWLPQGVLSGSNSEAQDEATGLKVCVGDCDADAQCATGLKCFQTTHQGRKIDPTNSKRHLPWQNQPSQSVPGCTGAGSSSARANSKHEVLGVHTVCTRTECTSTPDAPEAWGSWDYCYDPASPLVAPDTKDTKTCAELAYEGKCAELASHCRKSCGMCSADAGKTEVQVTW